MWLNATVDPPDSELRGLTFVVQSVLSDAQFDQIDDGLGSLSAVRRVHCNLRYAAIADEDLNAIAVRFRGTMSPGAQDLITASGWSDLAS